MIAVKNGDLEMIDLLLTSGLEKWPMQVNFEQLIQCAATYGHSAAVKLLLSKEALTWQDPQR
jgi:ankyrin repeat protein